MPGSLRSTVVAAAALAAALVAAPPACAQQGTAAGRDTPAGRRLAELVTAINSGDSATLARFVAASFVPAPPGAGPSTEERAERLLSMFGRTGGFEVHAVESPRATEASAVVQAKRAEAWRTLLVTVDSAAPNRILRVGVDFARDPGFVSPARRLSDAEVAAQLKAYVERLARRDAFSGTVLVARGGKPLYSAAVGEANKDFAAPNRLDTKFNLGSMNKMFTAVAVAQLAEAGKLSLDDSLGRFLPAGSMRPEVLAKVRVKHLLSHTSGLGSYFTPAWDSASRALYRSVDDWMTLVRNDSLAFEPGTRWAYSNTGMLVLGKVIERVSGQDYFDYVREHVYRPAGMTSSDSYELDRVNRDLAVGYERRFTRGGEEWRNNVFQHVIRGGPAGGGYSTVEDLTRFAEALKSGKLVGKRYVELLTTAKPELASNGYGYGFGISEDGRTFGHSGGFPGINSELVIFREGGYTIAVMSNYGGGAQPVVERARELLLAGRAATASR